MHIDLNCDLGEGFADDAELMKYVTSANIACGLHAGDATTMRRTVELAIEHNVAIGAHPSLNDREGFGRRELALSPEEARVLVLDQIRKLAAIVEDAGGSLVHVKLHGALYNMAAKDRALAQAIAKAVFDFDRRLILVGLSGSELIRAGEALGLGIANEVFADRTYLPNGTLMPRSEPGAVITDPRTAALQTMQIVGGGKVRAADGSLVELAADTVCVHGDTPGAAAFAKTLCDQLRAFDIEVQPLSS